MYCHHVCALQAFARNFTEKAREKERVKERAKEKEKKAQQKKKKVNDLERAGQKSGAAAYGNKQVLPVWKSACYMSEAKTDSHVLSVFKTKYLQLKILSKVYRNVLVLSQKNPEGPLKNEQHDGLEQQPPTRNKTGTQKPIKDQTEPKQPIKDKNSMVIRGVTFYKAEESYKEEDEEGKGKHSKSNIPLLL